MNTLQRIEKLISEYRENAVDCDGVIENARGWSDQDEARPVIKEWNARRQAYVTIIADLESIVDLSE